MKWDEWRGSLDGRPAMLIKRLLYVPLWRRAGKWLGCRVDLHKMVRADDLNCFHTHPAYAVRIILRGGYVEETDAGEFRFWAPLDIGIITPRFCHRLAMLTQSESYSLWIRGPICADVELRGSGWPRELLGRQSSRN